MPRNHSRVVEYCREASRATSREFHGPRGPHGPQPCSISVFGPVKRHEGLHTLSCASVQTMTLSWRQSPRPHGHFAHGSTLALNARPRCSAFTLFLDTGSTTWHHAGPRHSHSGSHHGSITPFRTLLALFRRRPLTAQCTVPQPRRDLHAHVGVTCRVGPRYIPYRTVAPL